MGANNAYRFELIPRCLWTQPEMGAVGLSEEDAEKKGFDVETGVFPYDVNGLAMARNLKSNIAKGKEVTPPVAFQGGVAHNLGVRRAFRDVLDHFQTRGPMPLKRREWDAFREKRYRTVTLFDENWQTAVLTQPAAIKAATDWARANWGR